MKVTLIKDHLQSKAGDEIEVTEQRAAYWKRLGVIADDSKPAKETVKETKVVETAKAAPKKTAKKK